MNSSWMKVMTALILACSPALAGDIGDPNSPVNLYALGVAVQAKCPRLKVTKALADVAIKQLAELSNGPFIAEVAKYRADAMFGPTRGMCGRALAVLGPSTGGDTGLLSEPILEER